MRVSPAESLTMNYEENEAPVGGAQLQLYQSSEFSDRLAPIVEREDWMGQAQLEIRDRLAGLSSIEFDETLRVVVLGASGSGAEAVFDALSAAGAAKLLLESTPPVGEPGATERASEAIDRADLAIVVVSRNGLLGPALTSLFNAMNPQKRSRCVFVLNDLDALKPQERQLAMQELYGALEPIVGKAVRMWGSFSDLAPAPETPLQGVVPFEELITNLFAELRELRQEVLFERNLDPLGKALETLKSQLEVKQVEYREVVAKLKASEKDPIDRFAKKEERKRVRRIRWKISLSSLGWRMRLSVRFLLLWREMKEAIEEQQDKGSLRDLLEHECVGGRYQEFRDALADELRAVELSVQDKLRNEELDFERALYEAYAKTDVVDELDNTETRHKARTGGAFEGTARRYSEAMAAAEEERAREFASKGKAIGLAAGSLLAGAPGAAFGALAGSLVGSLAAWFTSKSLEEMKAEALTRVAAMHKVFKAELQRDRALFFKRLSEEVGRRMNARIRANVRAHRASIEAERGEHKSQLVLAEQRLAAVDKANQQVEQEMLRLIETRF